MILCSGALLVVISGSRDHVVLPPSVLIVPFHPLSTHRGGLLLTCVFINSQGEISLVLPRVYAANQVLGPVRSARERSLMEGVGIENAIQGAGNGLVSKQVRETWETASAVPSSSWPGHLLNLLFVQMHR